MFDLIDRLDSFHMFLPAHRLNPAVGKHHVVGALHCVAITVLLLAEVSAGVVILDAVAEVVGHGLLQGVGGREGEVIRCFILGNVLWI